MAKQQKNEFNAIADAMDDASTYVVETVKKAVRGKKNERQEAV